MPRTTDSVRQFIQLRESLQRERDSLQQRLGELEAALGAFSGATAPTAGPAAPRRGRPPGSGAGARPATGRRGGRRPRNSMGMREAIAEVVKSTPMKIRDIVDGMESLGFRFKSKKPLNSVGAYLYGPEGRKHFKRADGKFSVK